MTKMFVDHDTRYFMKRFAKFHDHLILTLILQDVLRDVSKQDGSDVSRETSRDVLQDVSRRPGNFALYHSNTTTLFEDVKNFPQGKNDFNSHRIPMRNLKFRKQ